MAERWLKPQTRQDWCFSLCLVAAVLLGLAFIWWITPLL